MAKKYLDDNGLLYFWGKLKAYFATISHTHTKSEITDFPSTMTPTSHTHGNIQNGGTLQTTDVAIANGDKLVVTDNSDSNKVARTSVAFDGTTATKVLAKKGDWVDLPTGVSPSSTTPKMDGTATVGTETAFARGDHRHPSDTSRVPTSRTINGKALSSNVTIGAGDIATVIGSSGDNLDDDISALNTSLGGKANGNGRLFYGTCSTVSTTDTKDVTISNWSGTYSLTKGDAIIVDFTYNISVPDTPNDLKLAVAGTTAKTIKVRSNGGLQSATKGDIWSATCFTFTYDGSYWICDDYGYNKTYSNGTSEAISAGTSTNNYLWQPKILHDYIASAIETAQAGAATFQGTAPTAFAPTNYKSGYYWVVGTAGTYAGETCEAGDMIFATADYSSAYSASDFDVIQTNLDITDISNAEIDTIVAS